MSRSTFLPAICGAVALCLPLAIARAEPLRVALERPAANEVDATERLIAELKTEGYELSWIESERGVSPCADHTRASLTVPPAAAFIRFEQEGSAELSRLVAVICYARRERAFEQTSVSVEASDHNRLALAVVEALNGLKAEAQESASKPVNSGPPPRPWPGRSAALVNTALAFDALGSTPLVGAGFGLETGVNDSLSLQLDTFIPVRDSDSQGFRRELSLGAGWARLGPRLSWVTGPLRFGVSLQVGASAVWVSARSSTPERVGTTAATTTALVSSGLSLECPSATRFYLRAAGHVSRLLPRIQLARGDGSFLRFGDALLDMSIGFGMRWEPSL